MGRRQLLLLWFLLDAILVGGKDTLRTLLLLPSFLLLLAIQRLAVRYGSGARRVCNSDYNKVTVNGTLNVVENMYL